MRSSPRFRLSSGRCAHLTIIHRSGVDFAVRLIAASHKSSTLDQHVASRSSSMLSSSTLTRLAEEAQRATVCGRRPACADLIWADAAGLRHPVHLEVGVRRRDVRVQPAAAGGDRVGGHRGSAGAPPRIGHDLTDAVVLAELGALDAHALVGVQERRRCRSHGSLTLTTRVGWTTLPRASRGPITDSTAPTPSPVQNGRGAVHAFELADGGAARADQGEQAGLGVVVLGAGSAGVDDALRARGCSRWWPAGRSRRRPPTAGSGSTAAAGCRRRR